MIRRSLFLFLLLAVFALSATNTQAQALGGDDFSISLSPANPGPHEPVTIALKAYSFSMQTAEIDWTVDGGKTIGGIGYAKYNITTKSVGVASRVKVVVTPLGKAPITQTITIVPAHVDILWQAVGSTVPPFYRGKALVTSESDVKFVAIPQVLSGDGSLIPSSTLFYEWSSEYNPDDANSGYGKNTYATAMDYINPARHMSVDVSGKDGTIVASSDLTLDPFDPQLVLYASSPLYGALYDHALVGDYTVSDADASLIAVPYYFSPGNPTSSQLAYSWTLNGSPVTAPGVPNMLFLHRNDATPGEALVELSLVNTTTLLQEISTSLNIHLQ